MSDFCEVFKKYRLAKKRTYADIARIVGTYPDVIRLMEKGKCEPYKPRTIKRIAKNIGLDETETKELLDTLTP